MTEQSKQQFLDRLRAIRMEDPLLVGIRDLVTEIYSQTEDASHVPGLSADDRSYNDGRCSGLKDFLFAFEEAKRLADIPPDSSE